ncbi:MAG TPA: universal stress protein [Ktedonobacterales bacterium]|nr:universal stress protein [Ktedonobacterales bacterium]
MFKRILVPLDGSAHAEQAIPIAARLARHNQGSVILAQVVHIPTEYGIYAGAPIAVAPALVDTDRADAEVYLRHAAQHEALSGLHVETDAIIGLPAQDILDEITERHADAVVMSSHGRTGLGRWMLGSVAEHVARYAPVPVLILRHGEKLFKTTPQADRQPRILVPLDGSPLAEMALEPAASLALAFGADLHLALVVMPLEAMRENMPDALIVDGAKAYLSKVAHRMRAEHSGLDVSWSVGVNVDPAAAIIRIAEEYEDTEGAGVSGGCDVIAMATHGRTGLNRWALGSVTERVLHATRRPMLVVRAHRQEKAGS